jgi:excisionase family DNA binding protein
MTLEATPERITVRIKEACRITGIGRSKLYELIAEGEIDIVKVGTMTLIPVDSLKALTQSRRQRR